MRRRGHVAVLLGGAVLVAAWLFGSAPLAPVGVGLGAAGALSLTWRRLLADRVTIERRAPSRLVEGQRLEIELRARGSLLPVGRATVIEHVGALGAQEVPLRRGRGALVVEPVPRGVYELGPATLVLEDPLGLERVTRAGATVDRLCVRPRVVKVGRLFTGRGGRALGGRGRPVRSAAGLEPYGIRDYRDGEPLRSVHWPSTARRGELMVRELEEPGRDQLVVVLDGDRAGDVGPRGTSSFDDAVRASAAIVRTLVAAGRRVRLVVHGSSRASYAVSSLGAEWEAALDGLAAAQADAHVPVHTVVGGPRSVTAGAAEVVVVTCRPTIALARRLGGARRAALVAVDAPSYAGPDGSTTSPILLGLAARGVAVTVVRRGDDLASALAGTAHERLGA